jgi:hypothetical protein
MTHSGEQHSEFIDNNDESPQIDEVISPEHHGLKQYDEAELFQIILDAGAEWTDEERDMVVRAHDVGRFLHRKDKHRDQPYSYHLLRNTARLVKYLHINDPHVLSASILHDSVEDHPKDMIRYNPEDSGTPLTHVYIPKDKEDRQRVALHRIRIMFSPRVARIVEGMSNPPSMTNSELSYNEKLQLYATHLREAVEDPDVWAAKLCDWADNGLGIIHSDLEHGSKRKKHFELKYGIAATILDARYRRPDIQLMLDPVAKANVDRMFVLGYERLAVDDGYKVLGNTAVNGAL